MIKKYIDASSRVAGHRFFGLNRNQFERRLRPAILEQIAAGAPAKPNYFHVKYAMERLIAALLLLPAIPVIMICGSLVRLTSRGNAIYKQQRVGLNGQEFSMLKIRTMHVNAEAHSGPQWSVNADPRVTRVGRVLRYLHLDELPQLINVIKGEMTIIGPRPERPDIVNVLNDHIDNYTDRLVAKPGITGLAQIYLPPDETVDCVRKKVCFDRAYIESASPWVDVQIYFCTLVRILGVRNGRGPKWIGLDRRFSAVFHRCAEFRDDSAGSFELEWAPSNLDSGEIAWNGNHAPVAPDCTDNGHSNSSQYRRSLRPK